MYRYSKVRSKKRSSSRRRVKRRSRSGSRKHALEGRINKVPNFSSNLYYVKKNGDVVQMNKRSKHKSKVGKVHRRPGHMYFVKSDGKVYSTRMKYSR